MIVEYIRYSLPPSRANEFEAAYTAASSALDTSPHCLRYELARGVEEPQNWVLRIEWDSLDGHEHGFRSSPEFAEFFRAVQPFFDAIQEMRHYERTAVASA
jgi:quinol monooxygenase YgiN